MKEKNEAIEVLKAHNKWRKGKSEKMVSPKELSKAIDTIINYHEKLLNNK